MWIREREEEIKLSEKSVKIHFEIKFVYEKIILNSTHVFTLRVNFV